MQATILIIEDHEAVRSGLSDWLKMTFPGCRVIEATSGKEAIMLTITESPRLVLLDINLPGVNSIEAIRRIKAALPCARVVALTDHEDELHRAEAKAAGVSAYVPKRVMRTELMPALAALLAGGSH